MQEESEAEAEEEECNPEPVFEGDSAQVSSGLDYFRALNDAGLPLIDELQAAAASGDMTAAQAAYLRSRPVYEQVVCPTVLLMDI